MKRILTGLRVLVLALTAAIGVPGMTLDAVAAGPSTSFLVTGPAIVPPGKSFTLSALEGLNLPGQPVTQTVTFLSGSTPQTHTYTGISLWSLLNYVGILTDPLVKNDILNKYVVATGSDGYRVVISMGEIDPLFGNQPDFIAYRDENGLLTTDGFARLVVPGDIRGGRYVSNLVSLQVFSAPALVPEPASVALLLAGLAGIGLMRRRRSH